MNKCYCCKENATHTQTIGRIAYRLCWACATSVKNCTEVVKKLSENEYDTVVELVENVKMDKDYYYMSVMEAILIRKEYEQDLKDVIQAIKEGVYDEKA